ncbi:Phosphatidylinositol transfer protein sfh5 [Penicillium malachiteum]|uniref:Phosphatidylinositol transfer protein sfh5 n=1 Tax=Penicillium malachiteum TaxID=1324776 RepID=UPI002548A5F1|nr:Phosphatidylinositol transfer protein sfh5 [Penicillium malachiteum]KAJ5735764.1 Phosphatidylinositol transfer protein sfh5 [Penicillium malachiteum]
MSAQCVPAQPVEDNDMEIVDNEPAHEAPNHNRPMYDEDVIEIVDNEPAHEAPSRSIHDENIIEIADNEPAHEAPTRPMYDEDVIEIVDNEPTSEQTILDDDIIESIDNEPAVNPTVTMPSMASPTFQHTSHYTGCLAEAATPSARKRVRWDDSVRDVASIDTPRAASPLSAYKSKPKGSSKFMKLACVSQIKNLDRFFLHLYSIVHSAGHQEMWGVPLKGANDIHAANVLIKFLRANDGNLENAEKHLTKALKWRKKVKPQKLVESGVFSSRIYDGLGYVATYRENGHPIVLSWNIYDQVKTPREPVCSLMKSMKWRIAQVEMAVMQLHLRDATTTTNYRPEWDPYRIIEIHDCSSLTFLPARLAALIAIKRAAKVVSLAYPEVVQKRYFVGASPTGWLTSHLSRGCNFHLVSSQAEVAKEFPALIAEKLPEVYGGSGPELKEYALQVALVKDK